MTTSLGELQRRFFACVRDPAARAGEFVTGTARASREQRLGVYVYAYRARATEALQTDFPALHGYLGDEAFESLVHAYLEMHPSRSFTLRDFGAGLPAFLRGTAGGTTDETAGEIASFEWALCEAFDAADGEALGAEALAAVEPENWPTLRFAFHASLQRLELHTNAPAIWAAINDAATPPAVERRAAPVPWLVWRQQLKLMYRALPVCEAAVLDTAMAGANFGEVCVAMAEVEPPERVPALAAEYLGRWLAIGVGVKLSCDKHRVVI